MTGKKEQYTIGKPHLRANEDDLSVVKDHTTLVSLGIPTE
jgi:hypothetical protein